MMNNELILFGISVIYGLIYGFIYAILLINRENIKHLKITEYIEDFLYFLSITITTIHLIMVRNEGIFRGYIILAMVFGIALYFQTLHRLLRPIQIFIIDSIKELIKLICFIIKYIYEFIHKIYKKLFKTTRKKENKAKSQNQKNKNRLKNRNRNKENNTNKKLNKVKIKENKKANKKLNKSKNEITNFIK